MCCYKPSPTTTMEMAANFETMAEAFEYRAGQLGDTPAFIFRNRHHGRHVLTWADLYTLAGRFAHVLRQGGFHSNLDSEEGDKKVNSGMARGSLVVNALPNSPERVVCEAGILLSGAASVNGQCLMADASDLLHVLHVSRATAILLDPDVSDSPWHVLRRHVTLGPDDTVTSSESLPDLRKVYLVRRVEGQGPGDFLASLQSRQSWFKAGDIMTDDVVSVFTTSGSTGFSKLVPATHKMFADMLRASHGNYGFFSSDSSPQVDFNIAPLGWGGGCFYLSLMSGNSRVLVDVRDGGVPKNMAEVIWRSIQEEHCTRSFMTPKYLPQLGQLAGGDSAAHKMKVIMIGGMPVNRSMVKAGLAIAEEIYVMYGGTELGMISELHLTDWQSYVDYDCGPPAAWVKVKVVSQDDESVELPVSQVGHILIRQQIIPQGFLNNPEATANLFTKDGWVRTGDVGRLDERGHLLVEGRGSDAIMRGPYIHYPAWVEDRIRVCPQVRDVMVVGVPDPFLHEELCACVVLASQPENEDTALKEVEQWVKQDIVASEDDPLSPRPRYYLSFASFPETDTNKPRRKEVKKMAAKRMKLA